MKRCTKCDEEKPTDAFPPRKDHSADGLHTECRECRRRYHREYARARRKADPEAAREAERAWRERNPEADRARQVRYRQRHAAKLRANRKAFREAHPERVREAYDKWRASHIEQERLRLATRRALTGEADAALRDFIRELRESPCAYCGATDNIHIDHVIPLARGGTHTPENLAPACGSCNSSKGTKPVDEWLQSRAA